jgi:hypothetical protein
LWSSISHRGHPTVDVVFRQGIHLVQLGFEILLFRHCKLECFAFPRLASNKGPGQDFMGHFPPIFFKPISSRGRRGFVANCEHTPRLTSGFQCYRSKLVKHPTNVYGRGGNPCLKLVTFASPISVVLSDPRSSFQLLRWGPTQDFTSIMNLRFGEASQLIALWCVRPLMTDTTKRNEHRVARPWGGLLNKFLSVVMEINHCHGDVQCQGIVRGGGRWR